MATEAQPSSHRATKADYGPVQVLDRTGLAEWQWRAARALGMIPDPDIHGRRWSADLVDDVASRRHEIVAAIGSEPPLGGHRAAERLTNRTGLPVTKWEVEALADQGLLTPCDSYKGWPLYRVGDLDAIQPEQLAPLVDDRRAWMVRSVLATEAPTYVGLQRIEFLAIAAKRGLAPGPFRRYARDDLDALAASEELRQERLLMTHQAAHHLGIRHTDFRYLVAARLAVPDTYAEVQITPGRRVRVAFYRVGDLDKLRDHPGIDWRALRAVKVGDPSPLRGLAPAPHHATG